MSGMHKNIFFLGVGGIGMSALARYFKHSGKEVGGYDKTPSSITESLQKEGIAVSFDDAAETLQKILPDGHPGNTTVVYTPAIPLDSILYQHIVERGYPMMKRARALGQVTADTVNLSIAGTHGKTTTSCLLAHLLQVGGIPHVSILGGISSNFGSNYSNTLSADALRISVTEADEFDRSFLQLSPMTAAITSLDADHLDIYGDESQIKKSFFDFARKVKVDGRLYVQADLQDQFAQEGIRVSTYGIEHGQTMAAHLHIHEKDYVFDLYHNNEVYRNLRLGIPGRHNVENAVVASAMALDYGVAEDALRTGLQRFTGVKRRFEYILRKPAVFIDDYAHHPTELRAIIGSVRALYPNHQITGIFQPHLYTRTRDFAEGFSQSLSELDRLILLDIYPARELPIPGVTSSMLLKGLDPSRCILMGKEEAIEAIAKERPELLLTLGAGDIDRLVPRLKEVLEKGGAGE